MATFTWKPLIADMELTRRPAVRVAKFGDGYEQRAAYGINTMTRIWRVRFTDTQSAAVTPDIDAFLAARGGLEAFEWTDPTGVAGKYVCREWRRTWEPGPGYAYGWLDATFEEVKL